MFSTTTLSAKSESFNESPSSVCSCVSRSSCDRVTDAPGGGALFDGGVFVTRLAGALFVATSLELQPDNQRALIRPTAISVSITRPGVQKDFPPARLGEGFVGRAI